MSRGGVVTYRMAKELTRILRPLIGHSFQYIKNPDEFIEQVKTIKCEKGECIASYDVKVLFRFVSMDPTFKILKNRPDAKLHNRISISIKHIIVLLGLCFKNTHFFFQSRLHEQIQGAGMGSPISQILAKCFMEGFEIIAISTSPILPRLWRIYVDGTLIIQKTEHKNQYLEHINFIDLIPSSLQ